MKHIPPYSQFTKTTKSENLVFLINTENKFRSFREHIIMTIIRSQHLKNSIQKEKERIINDQERSIKRIMRMRTIKHQRKIIDDLKYKLEIFEKPVQKNVHWSQLLCEDESY